MTTSLGIFLASIGDFTWFLKLDLHSQNLPEPYASMRPKKNRKTMWRLQFFSTIHLHSQNLPEAYNSMRDQKKPKPSKSIHEKEIQNKKWKKREVFFFGGGAAIPRQHIQEPCAPMRKIENHVAFHFFLLIHLHSQNLPDAYS